MGSVFHSSKDKMNEYYPCFCASEEIDFRAGKGTQGVGLQVTTFTPFTDIRFCSSAVRLLNASQFTHVRDDIIWILGIKEEDNNCATISGYNVTAVKKN